MGVGGNGAGIGDGHGVERVDIYGIIGFSAGISHQVCGGVIEVECVGTEATCAGDGFVHDAIERGFLNCAD